ncbi:MAG: tetratricopeptide repeat protein [Chitinophagaceae bacterium]|nr:tetratricopeptide repeat protein [Chitinophagaceae bacterium]
MAFFKILTRFSFAIMCFAFIGIRYSNAQIPFSNQPEKTQTRSGNNEYQKSNFTEAEANYKKALDIKNNMPEATFNLGDAVYEQKRYEDAQKQFQLAAKTNADVSMQAKAFHNLGNAYLEQKKYEDAIAAYKNALKINPADADTKYNLAFANAMLQKNQDGDGNDNKKQDQKNQDNKDQKDQQNKDQQNQDQKDQQNKDQENKDQQANNQDQKDNQQQQPQKSGLTRQEADQLLAALENEEQKVNQKMQKKQMKGVRVRIKKDW